MLVEKKSFTVSDFALELGAVLKTMTIGYETYGRLNADTSNAPFGCAGVGRRAQARDRTRRCEADRGCS